MKCWNCGADLAPGAAFCNNCGAKQEQTPPSQKQPPHYGGQQPNNSMVLTAFAAICMAVCGGMAIRSLFYALRGLLNIGWAGVFGTIRIVGLNGLAAVMLALMAAACALIAFKRTRQNSDGLLVCLGISGAGFLIVRLLSMLVSLVIYPHGFGSYLGGFVTAVLGVAVAIGGVYAIERFVLGETPIMGKSVDELKMDVQAALDSLQQTASEVGAQASQAAQNAKAEREARAAQQAQYNAYQSTQTPPPPQGYAVSRLKADRSLIAYILLTFITCGIYGWYFIYALARDVNIACAGDGRSTAGLIKLVLLSMITCGIYGIYWYYSLGNRLAANAPRYGLVFQENGTTILLWEVIGLFLCGLGPLVAMHIIIKNTNALCGAYNYQHGI